MSFEEVTDTAAHLSQNSITVCFVTNNHSDGPQVVDAVQLLALLLHLVEHAPQVLGPA